MPAPSLVRVPARPLPSGPGPAQAKTRLLDLERERAKRAARRHLLPFTLWTFPGYELNWHHRVIADYLTRLVYGDITRLILCVGPRRGKSELANRRLVAFALGLFPDWEVITTSWGADLATEMSRDTKRILLGEEYRELFPGTSLNPRHVVTDDRAAAINTADRWDVLGRRGKYKSAGVGGGISGRGFNLGIIDDPFKDDVQAQSEAYRDQVWRWYKKAFWTRRAPGARIVVMHTRWHEDDLVGRLLAEARSGETAEQWVLVNLREVREDEPNGDDPRSPGEVLWPARFPLTEALELERSDPATFAALYQQRPAPVGGYEVQLDWLQRRYTVLPVTSGHWRISWDLRNGGKTSRSSFAVGQVWFRPFNAPGTFYLVDQVRGQWDYPEEELRFVQLCERYPQVVEKLVENKADGRVLIPRLKSLIPGLVAIEPAASKTERLRSVLPLFRAGNVVIPEPSIAPWVAGWIHELTTFPAAPNDDQVDTTSQALQDWAAEGRPAAKPWWM